MISNVYRISLILCFLIVPLSIFQFLDTPTKLMKLRLEILEILYNFVTASTPVSVTVKQFSAGHIFGFLYIYFVLPKVGRSVQIRF
jgi:hypothetical protein